MKSKGIVKDGYLYDVFGDAVQIAQNADQYITNYHKNLNTTFTGNFSKLTLQNGLKESEAYSGGNLTKHSALVGIKHNSNLVIQSSKKVNDDGDCIDWYWNTWDEFGNLIGHEYVFTTCDCGIVTATAVRDHLGTMTIFLRPSCDGAGGGGGGTGDAPDTTKKPCVEVSKINAMQANSLISSQNSTITDKLTADPNHEWGVDHRINSLANSTFMNTTPSIGPDRSTWNYPTFYWDDNNGHTVGWSHDHPDAGPDCIDIALGLQMFNQHLYSSPVADQAFYQSNFSVTTITQWGTYVVTVSDWAAYTNVISGTYQQVIANMDADWQTKANDYVNNNSNANNGDAAAYALMKIFGSSINVFFAAPGQTTYTPKRTNANYGIETNPCN